MIAHMKYLIVLGILVFPLYSLSQFDLKAFNRTSGVIVNTDKNELLVRWPAGAQEKALLRISMDKGSALIKSMGWQKNNNTSEIARDLDPVFVLTVGKRDLVSQNGWNIFFDKVHLKPYQAHLVQLEKKSARVATRGASTVISIDEISAPGFKGRIEITLYTGSPLINIAAVMSTAKDSTAIVYDAGLVNRTMHWDRVSWSNTEGQLKNTKPAGSDTAKNEMVKYRTIIGHTPTGSLAIFPAPHQYFYPLDEAFNLRFVWHGNAYRKMVDGYGLGIRQELHGDNRFVPWFNAPPGTEQRMNFFCLLSPADEASTLQQVKKYTNNDRYVSLPGYKTLSSHFHNEFIMKVVMAGKPIPDTPNFVKVFKALGVDIVHLGEFHYTAHPKGPDETRLKEMHALFEQCRRLSDKTFLLLPGEEPNEFLGGHWLQFFPKPVYWIMSRKPDQPFVSEHPQYGTVYRVGNAAEMLELLQKVNGLAWTAHPRTKGSKDHPDKYKNENFFLSDHFLGAAWKPMPADLSLPRLGQRVLDLLDDMNNWGVHKKILAESDIFTIEPENEMYAHMNVNYLQLDRLPSFDEGWQPVIDAIKNGRYFSGTGEVLIPRFNINGSTASFDLQWTFPLNFAELISGDGTQVYRQRINLDNTRAFGKKTFSVPAALKGRKWVRLEVWDVAANGAFTQTTWLK
jgi:hypothetical protein